MENIEFDFENKEYLLYIRLDEEAEIGVIEIENENIENITEIEKEKLLKNITNLDYDILYKLEQQVNPKGLVKIIKFINEAIYYYCDTKIKKEILEQNLKNKYQINIVWKIKL